MRRLNVGEKIGFGLAVVGSVASAAGWGELTWLRIINFFGLVTLFVSGLFIGYSHE